MWPQVGGALDARYLDGDEVVRALGGDAPLFVAAECMLYLSVSQVIALWNISPTRNIPSHLKVTQTGKGLRKGSTQLTGSMASFWWYGYGHYNCSLSRGSFLRLHHPHELSATTSPSHPRSIVVNLFVVFSLVF